MLNKLKINIEQREKTAFFASDYGKPILDLYFAFKQKPYTNPTQWFRTLCWGAGKGVEESMLKVLKDSDIVYGDYNQKENGRIEIEREGIRINGYVDAITKEGIPIEIKSINNKNSFDIKRYASNKPRENYVGQLCVYMDALSMDTGYLFVSSIDGLNRFWLECKKIGERKYKCGDVEVDLDKVYKRWAKLYNKNVVPSKIPNPFEYQYKIPVENVDWSTVSKTDISKARNNKKVIGDWEILFSSWKDLIIEMQESKLGYSREELDYIKDKTKGFTTW